VNKQPPREHGHAPNDGAVHSAQAPYWTRAHRDWRVWVGAVLMVIALGVYVLSGDLGWLYRTPSQQSPPVGGPHG